MIWIELHEGIEFLVALGLIACESNVGFGK